MYFQTIDLQPSPGDDKVSGQLQYTGRLRKVDEMPTEDLSKQPVDEELKEIPNENMAFEFSLDGGQFSAPGNYFLKLALASPLEEKDLSDIKVEKNNEGKYEPKHELKSDTINAEEGVPDAKYDDQKWTFFIPAGKHVLH